MAPGAMPAHVVVVVCVMGRNPMPTSAAMMNRRWRWHFCHRWRWRGWHIRQGWRGRWWRWRRARDQTDDRHSNQYGHNRAFHQRRSFHFERASHVILKLRSQHDVVYAQVERMSSASSAHGCRRAHPSGMCATSKARCINNCGDWARSAALASYQPGE